MLVVAAQPVLEFLAGVFLEHLDTVVHASETDPATDEPAHQGAAVLVGERVLAPAVGVDHDGRSIFERGLVRDPAVVMALHDKARHLGQPALEQQGARAELVHAGRMAGTACDQDKLPGLA